MVDKKLSNNEHLNRKHFFFSKLPGPDLCDFFLFCEILTSQFWKSFKFKCMLNFTQIGKFKAIFRLKYIGWEGQTSQEMCFFFYCIFLYIFNISARHCHINWPGHLQYITGFSTYTATIYNMYVVMLSIIYGMANRLIKGLYINVKECLYIL